MKQKLLTLFVALFATLALWAYDFKNNGICYNYISENELEVAYSGGYKESITIPSSFKYNKVYYTVTRIGNGAFENTGITSITIPNSITSIGSKAFYNCSGLTSITIPKSVTSIGSSAFYGCSGLTSITIPNSVTSIGSSAFRNCKGLTNIIIDNENAIYDSRDNCNAIIETASNTLIAGCKNTIIPNSVTSIGSSAFYGCSGLTSITIPNSVTSIGSSAFYGCSGLTSITIPNSVTSIGSSAFYGCKGLTSITIPESVTSIGSEAFYKCSGLTSITIPNSVTSIGSSAFCGCSGLTSITIPNSVTSIGSEAFYGCKGLTSITIPNSVTSIGNGAFRDCSGLTSITIPNSVTSIGDYAFDGCSGLTSITIPNSVTSIGSSVFYGCSGLTNIIIDNENAIYDSRDNCNAIIETASNTLIAGCKNTIIPNSVTSIGEGAFYYCDVLKSITIPNSVTSIGSKAFYGCSYLKSITVLAENPPTINSGVFYNVSKSIPIYVPCGQVNAYKKATGWNEFSNIQEQLAKYNIEVSSNNNVMGSAQVDFNTYCTGSKITATPNLGYHFVQWSDGNTENPRTLELTQDTILIAEFAQSFSGQCGDSLYWVFDESASTLSISGSGSMYTYTESTQPWLLFQKSITTVEIGDNVTNIDANAFLNCISLASVIWNAKNCADFSSNSSSPFYDIRSQITSFTFGDSVQHIPERLCYDMSNLTSVTLGNSVTSIGDWAFRGCSGLTSVTIPNSVTSIGFSAFDGCSGLTSITIPNSVTSIGSYAFEDCSGLTSVVWNAKECADFEPTEYKDESYSPFNAVPNITSFTFGDSVQHIPAYLCYGMNKLASITLSNNITSVGSKAFGKCTGITKITLTANTLEDYCKSKINGIVLSAGHDAPRTLVIAGEEVKDLVIPNTVDRIYDKAFYRCLGLKSITIPNSVTNIGKSTFSRCSAMTSVSIGDGVTNIGESAFSQCSAMTSVSIGDGVTNIGESAFSQCSALTSVTIPNSVTSIGESAFAECYGLTSVTIGSGVTSIGSKAFYGCSGLNSITVLAEIPPTISSYVFNNVGKSIPIYVPCGKVDTYKNAEQWNAFNNIQEVLAEYNIQVSSNETTMGTAQIVKNTACEAQISATPNFGYHFVQWSDGNTENPRTLELTQDTILIAEFAQSFSGQCGDSLYWELVDTTLHITGKGKMYNYKSDSAPWKVLVSSIKVLTIAEDVTKLSQSFDSCSVLESIVWNAKHAADAYSDGQYVYPIFYEIRSQIKSFTFGENVEYIPTYLCAGMDKLTSMIIPNSVTSIGGAAFYICSSLALVTIPNSVTSIGDVAFRGCYSLTSITIPNSVTSIGNRAFEGCNNITSITWNAKNCNTYNFGSQVTSFEFGNEVEVVPSSLCKGMEKLTSMTIPNSVKTIGTSAFEGCVRLGKISLGTGLEEIAANAFAGCTRLYDIYTYATYPPFAEESSFENYSATLYIPCESMRDYRLDPVWSKFATIECIEDSEGDNDDENVGTTIEDVLTDNSSNTQKIISNGKLIILRDGKAYNAQGQIIKE